MPSHEKCVDIAIFRNIDSRPDNVGLCFLHNAQDFNETKRWHCSWIDDWLLNRWFNDLSATSFRSGGDRQRMTQHLVAINKLCWIWSVELPATPAIILENKLETTLQVSGWTFFKWWVIMMTLLSGNIFRVTRHLCGEFTGYRWIPRTKASDEELWCFLWSAPWINGWVNNREAGDLRRRRAHYDVIVMFLSWPTAACWSQHWSYSSIRIQ